MSIATLTMFRAFLREVPSTELDLLRTEALDAAEVQANKFVGYDIAAEFEGAPTSDIRNAVYLMGQNLIDQGSPDEVEMRRARAESLLRPYRRDTGIAA